MSAAPLELLDRFAGLTVLVLGDAILDAYLRGSATRLCREAPAPVVAVEQREYAPGGAANTAHNVRRLGARALFLSVTGDDYEGELLRSALHTAGVDTRFLLGSSRRQTLSKQRLVADGQTLMRFDLGTTGPLDAQLEAELLCQLEQAWTEADAVLVSDYAYGTITPGVLERLTMLRPTARVLVVDARDLARYRRLAPTAVKPNYAEATALLEVAPLSRAADRLAQLERAGGPLLERTGASICAVTIDADGALVFERGKAAHRVYARPSPPARTTGAGDTFAAALTLALAAGADTPIAVNLAAAAAEAVVGRDGTVACTVQDLRRLFMADSKVVADRNTLCQLVQTYRARSMRVVFTNGCFDLLHRGHVRLLRSARNLGDVLFVGLNGDASVRQLKGPDRPINSLGDRAQVLAALDCVDHVVPFDSATPFELIAAIRPDVFVKGADYTRDTLPEAKLVERLGGCVRLVPLVDDRSTTRLIEQILDSGSRGRNGLVAQR